MLPGTLGSNCFRWSCFSASRACHLHTAWTPPYVGVWLAVRSVEQICGNRTRSPGMVSGPSGSLAGASSGARLS